MSPFDWRAALRAALGMLLIVELSGLFAGIKECGFGYEDLMGLFLALIVYAKFPWVILLITAISFAAGFFWQKGLLYRTLGKLVLLIALFFIPTAAFLVAPHTGRPCSAI